MRQMKAVQAKGGKLSDMPPPPPSNYDHYIQCRHCGRKYAPDVAERHIPKCANIINKPGGIKPSRIQEKYIAGTGAGNKSNVYSQPSEIFQKGGIPMKPNFSSASNGMNSGFGGSSYDGNSKPFKSSIADSYKQKSPVKGQFNYGEANKSYGNSMGGQKSMGPPATNSYQMGGSSFKPNLKSNSKTNANKYW